MLVHSQMFTRTGGLIVSVDAADRFGARGGPSPWSVRGLRPSRRSFRKQRAKCERDGLRSLVLLPALYGPSRPGRASSAPFRSAPTSNFAIWGRSSTSGSERSGRSAKPHKPVSRVETRRETERTHEPGDSRAHWESLEVSCKVRPVSRRQPRSSGGSNRAHSLAPRRHVPASGPKRPIGWRRAPNQFFGAGCTTP